MTTGAQVKSLQSLVDLKHALIRLSGDLAQTADRVAVKNQQTRDWLDDRERYWRYQVEEWSDAVYRAHSALDACLSDENSNGCGYYEEQLNYAYRRLHEAEAELATVQAWRQRIESACADYERQAALLRNFLQTDAVKASRFLDVKMNDLENYLAVTSPSTDQVILAGMASVAIKESYKGAKEGQHYNTQWMMQGKAGEMVAKLCGNRICLDELAVNVSSARGGWFVLYDNLDQTTGEIGSVKVKGVRSHNNALSDAQLRLVMQRYLRDFKDAIGDGNIYKFNKAATMFIELKEKKLISVPEQMQKIATVTEMETYQRGYGQIQIPYDHVDGVRALIKKEYAHLDPDRLEKLTQRVVPLLVSSVMICEMLDQYQTTRKRLRKLQNKVV